MEELNTNPSVSAEPNTEKVRPSEPQRVPGQKSQLPSESEVPSATWAHMSGGNNRLAALAADIRAAHQESSRAALTLVERALAAGSALIEAKRLVVHGKWQPWLRENCGLRERTARRYMALAASGLKTATVAGLGLRAASEALGRLRTASDGKTGAKNDRDVPAVPTQASTDRHAGSQAIGVTASASLDPESGDRDAVIRADPQDLFPDHNQDVITQRRRRSKRPLLFPRTPEEQYAEWMTSITGSDDLPEVLERLKGLEPEEVIEALEKGPWLRAQR